MRSYAKNWAFKKTVTYKQRQERLDTEWDIRVDVCDALTKQNIINYIKESLDDIQYVLVSGIERPDNDDAGTNKSNGNHLHIALILYTPMQRNMVLKLVRGPRKLTDEYAAPRNRRYTYGGWILHHTKPNWKLDGEPLLSYEYGTSPMDPLTVECALRIKAMIKKFGDPSQLPRFTMHLNLLERDAIKRKIEQLQMSLEDNDANCH